MDRRTVFSTKWFSIAELTSNSLPKSQEPYYALDMSDGVIILPVTQQGEIVMVRQYRPCAAKVTLELPAGAIEDGERPEDAAARELYEETGYRAGEFIELGSGYLMMNRTGCRNVAFLARQLVLDASWRPAEEIATTLVDAASVPAMVRSGEYEQLLGLGVMQLAGWQVGWPGISPS